MVSVAQARPSDRAKFIRQTYTHLAGAVAAFILVEFILFQTGIAEVLFNFVAGSRFAWFAILGGFSLLGWMSRGLVSKADSVEKQYAGLGLYVVGEALIFAPLLYIATYYSGDPNLIPSAAILTLLLFGGLTTVAFTTRKDFSFLGNILKVGGFIALGLIVCSLLFGFTLGLLFSVVMVVFASAAILYSTSKIIHNYTVNQYVAASLELFASVALLFYYVVQILLKMSSRN
ncbi:MAG: Bax inhibitor-1 family protein [Cyanobacteria bacterium P01_A01_bin.40]